MPLPQEYPIELFNPRKVDIYTGGALVPPPVGDLRAEDVTCLMLGASVLGFSNRLSTSFAFTHILLFDTSIEIRDGYQGFGGVTTANEDFFAIPADQRNNFWSAVIVNEVTIPGIGKRKLVLADRRGAVGSWPTIL